MKKSVLQGKLLLEIKFYGCISSTASMQIEILVPFLASPRSAHAANGTEKVPFLLHIPRTLLQLGVV
jgi:hypothetical protein